MDADRPKDPPHSVPPNDSKHFDPENLIKTVIAVPLLKYIDGDPAALQYIIIDVNLRHGEGRDKAKGDIFQFIVDAIQAAGDPNVQQGAHRSKSESSRQYVYARLQGKVIRELVARDQRNKARSIFHVWPDFIVRAQIWKSVPTVKADACRRSFATTGKGILWAILDSGIDAAHPHFAQFGNLKDLPGPVTHMDFTTDPPGKVDAPVDNYGHGTHVAGIIAGQMEETQAGAPVAIVRE